MEIGTLLNQNVSVHLEDDGHTVKLFNTTNKMELARFSSESLINCWGNPGGFMTKEDYDKYVSRKELHRINIEMIQDEMSQEEKE